MYKLRQCFECILDLDLIFALNAIFFCEIMDDERFFIGIHFMMEDEMTMIIIPPLEKGFSSPVIVAPQLMQFSIVKWCHKKKKKKNVERRWNDITFTNILDLCEKEWWHFVCHSIIKHILAPNTTINFQMNVVAKKNKFKKRFKKWKANINIIKLCQKNKSKVMGQHGHSLNTWQISWKVPPKEKVHLKRFDQCTMKIIEKDNDTMLRIQTITFTFQMKIG